MTVTTTVHAMGPDMVAVLGPPFAGAPTVLYLSLGDARDLAADLIQAITT